MGNLNFGARAPHMQQFDLKGKETRDLTPEELEANLRAHNCPAHLVARTVERHCRKFGYTRKQPVVGGGSDVPKVKLEERVARMLELLDKTARALGRDLRHTEAMSLLDSQRRDTSPTYQADDHTCTNPAGCYHCMRSHLRTAYDLAECSYVLATQVNDMLDDWPGTENGDMEEDSLRAQTPKAKAKLHNAFRRLHRDVHRMLGETCNQMYQAGLTVNQIVD